MESISSNLKNQKGYGIGLKTVGIWAALQLYSPPPLPISLLLLFKKQDNNNNKKKNQNKTTENSLAVQSLGLGSSTDGTWVQSLVKELRSHKKSLSTVLQKERQQAEMESLMLSPTPPRQNLITVSALPEIQP